jgi:hypothetical protein
MNLGSGAEILGKAKELKDHFINEGTPIMIGGDLYAHTILGIDYCEEKLGGDGDNIRFLVLDPHFPGSDSNIKNVISKGWIGWKEGTMFKADSFYNLCMP